MTLRQESARSLDPLRRILFMRVGEREEERGRRGEREGEGKEGTDMGEGEEDGED